MNYTVKYKCNGDWFWTTLKKVHGDGVYTDIKVRFFELEDETLIQIPLDAKVRFSPERVRATEKKMSQEAGQPIQRV